MSKKFLVAPSILSADFANLQREVEAVTQAGADWIHVDVMDGQFVPNLTIGAPVVKALKRITRIPLDVHLMIVEPERYIDDFIAAGADYLTIHVEATKDPAVVLRSIRAKGAKPGITLRPQTAIDKIMPFLPLVDLALVMTVNPGFGGQSFMPEQGAKLSQLKQECLRLGRKVILEVDGGINPETARQVPDADMLVAGNYVFKNDYATAIRALKEAHHA
ncbi:MAG: ribulose-phosphate 3-epimerase [Bdellovibrionales bacterium]